MNIISYSLWGNDLKYYKGALENIRIAKLLYPNWVCRFYVDKSVDVNFCQVLKKYNAQVILINNVLGPYHGMYWRYLVNDDPNVTRYVIRDADSRHNTKEQAAVEDWIKSGKSFHNMRDCPGHYRSMQGAMWGGTANKFNIEKLVKEHGKFEKWGDDEFFLSNHVWPLIKDDCCIHDPFIDKIPFPEHKAIRGFVGERYDINNRPLP